MNESRTTDNTEIINNNRYRDKRKQIFIQLNVHESFIAKLINNHNSSRYLFRYFKKYIDQFTHKYNHP